MKLVEFFSRPMEIDQNQKKKEGQDPKFEDDLFWFILDHDKLHKDYFFPIAKKLKSMNECGEDTIYEMFMPMVVKGCKEYYADRKMEGRMSKKFPLEIREGLCRRLYDHYREDVKKGKYRLG
jgi:hypothetical protein